MSASNEYKGDNFKKDLAVFIGTWSLLAVLVVLTFLCVRAESEKGQTPVPAYSLKIFSDRSPCHRTEVSKILEHQVFVDRNLRSVDADCESKMSTEVVEREAMRNRQISALQ